MHSMCSMTGQPEKFTYYRQSTTRNIRLHATAVTIVT